MDKEKLKELQKIYSEYSDEKVLSCLIEKKDDYEPEAYVLLCEEANKRSIKISESEYPPKHFPELKQEFTYTERKIVFNASDLLEANLIQSLLKSSGIAAYVPNEIFQRINPFIPKIAISVPSSQEEDALNLLREYLREENNGTKVNKMESRRSIGITIFSWFLIVIDGFIISTSLVGLIVFIMYPETLLQVLSSMRQYGYNFDMRGYYIYSLLNLILYMPEFIGAIALLKLKEWGRKLVIIANLVLISYDLYRIITLQSDLKITTVISIVEYVIIIYFFTRSGIKKQFNH